MSAPLIPETNPGSGPVLGPDPELIGPLVADSPSVAGLHSGRYGEVATYLPGRRVRGVRVTEAGVEVHVVARYPVTVAEVDAQVRAAVMRVSVLPVHLTIADVALPGDPDPGGPIQHDPVRRSPDDRRPDVAGPGDSALDGPRSGVPAFPPAPTEHSVTSAGRSPVLGLDSKETSR